VCGDCPDCINDYPCFAAYLLISTVVCASSIERNDQQKRLSCRKINGMPRMELKRRTTDYTELAYREAILKLKYLLNGSYVGPTDVAGT